MNAVTQDKPASESTLAIEKKEAASGGTRAVASVLVPDTPLIASAGEGENPEFGVLAAWYAAHSSVRRLWATRDAFGLRVLVTLEPTLDDSDSDPSWIAYRRAWTHELQSCTDRSVRLERLDEPIFDGGAINAEGLIVAILSWQDPSST